MGITDPFIDCWHWLPRTFRIHEYDRLRSMTNEEGILYLTDVTISFCDAVVSQSINREVEIPSLIKHQCGTNGHDLTAPTAVGSKLSKKVQIIRIRNNNVYVQIFNSIQFNSIYFQHTSTFHTVTTTCTLCAGKGADRRQCL